MDTPRPPAAGPSSVFSFHRKPRPSETTTTTTNNNNNAHETREAIIREAKRHIREVVRNDWAFEPSFNPHSSSNPPSSSPPDPHASSSPSAAATAADPHPPHPLPVEVLEWRLRECETSGSELEPQAGPVGAVSPPSPSDHDHDENPDAVRASVVERRRRWRRQLEEEMRWNPGLRTWVERRNAWSGARKWSEIQQASTAASCPLREEEEQEQEEQRQQQTKKKHQRERVSSIGSAGSRISAEAEAAERGSDEPSSPSSSTNLPAATAVAAEEKEDREQEQEAQSEGLPTSLTPDPDDLLIPIVPPLLPPDNPIRASITPAIYPSIYSKVVVQGLTPTVPINLADVTKAIVEGWKNDGQWPPKPTPVVPGDDILVRRKGSSSANGNGNGHLNNNNNNAFNNDNEKARRSSHHHHLGGVGGVTGAVKKVLGLSGLHSHHHSHSHGHGHHHHLPFHLRGSSHDGADGGAGGGGGRRGSEASGDIPVVGDRRDPTKAV
ncbi:hypothetical protein VTN00DRAFT_6867 [Thermoascus crustaceus]|uniref:uncharacterized protein n=1 Tax=Thermoascus crustaceus TaxID=5088 RepID=UPI0037427B89